MAFIGIAVYADEKADADREKILGNWTVLSGQEDGKALPQEKVKGSHVTFTKDMITCQEEKEKRVMSYKLDPTANPKRIDTTMTEGSDKGKTSHGIYALDGDNLKVCYAQPGQERPKDFSAKEGSKATLLVLKRAAR
jgi:uncharacterized protein (TIGR03067 family)